MKKRIISMLLIAVMLLGLFPVRAQAEEPQTAVDNSDITVSGENGFGTLLAEDIAQQQSQMEEDEAAGYSVTDLEITGNTATVTYASLETATLVVAIYTEDGMQLLTSGKAEVIPDETVAVVTIEGEMPQYFTVSAYLLDSYDLSPLCIAYDTLLYTKEMQDLLASTEEAVMASGYCTVYNEPANTQWKLYRNGTLSIYGTGEVGDGDTSWEISVPWEQYLQNIRNVVLQTGIVDLGRADFYYCVNLSSVILPEGLRGIRSSAFSDSSNLQYNVFGNAKYLGTSKNPYYALMGPVDQSITNCTVHSRTKIIAGGAFQGCTKLTSITIPDSVECIEEDAFEGCSSLQYSTYGNGRYLGNASNPYHAFIGAKNTGITSCTVYRKAKLIAGKAFSDCNSLTTVTIPNSVTSIGSDAFNGCRSLTTVTIPNSVTFIGSWAFKDCSKLTTVDIPNSVTYIGSGMFCCCIGLTTMPIPNSATSIKGWVFYKCKSLTTVTIPNSVTFMGRCVFEDCSSLATMTIPNSVATIGGQLFSDCTSLTTVTLPNSVTSIRSSVFYNCSSLTTVTIPGSVTSIGSFAFRNCGKLKNVYYTGTQAQWNGMAIGSYNEPLTNATIHYNSIEPATAPTVTMKFPSLSFEDVIIMNVYYTATDIQDVVEMGLITYTEKPTEASVETADRVVPGYYWSEGDQMYYSRTAGIVPKDLGDTIYFGVYYKLKDGTYGYTRIIGYSPKTYAMNMLKTSTPEMKTLVAAMLNYGTAAQNYFSYKTDALVNADMTDEQKALAAEYSGDMIATITQASGTKLGTLINDKTYSARYTTITFEGAFCINYYFKPTLAVEDDVTMYVWSLEDFNGADVLSKENATKAVKMTLTDSGEYTATIDGIAAKDLNKAVYVSFVYNDGITEHCGGVLGYTIGMYCKTQAAKTGTLSDLAQACAVYGYYAKQLFN